MRDEMTDTSNVNVEKEQEMLLMNKLNATGKGLPKGGQSSFLQKKLQQRKFFDSGDYAMNQDKEKKHHRLVPGLGGKPLAEPIAESTSPTTLPTATLPIVAGPAGVGGASNAPLAAPLSPTGPSASAGSGDEEEEHLVIPRPDTVPQRKASILHPSAHSKLSPQPIIHHEHNDDLLSSPQN